MHLPIRLGDFELTALLGEGGTGEVYGGTKGETAVALKVLRSDLALTERERARFFDEAARMRRVTHPSIVAILEAGVLPDGRPFIAMPRIAGESLAERLIRGPLPISEGVARFTELASALSVLHGARLVHRDIKPANIFVADGHAVLLDLGIAREVDAAPSTTTAEGKIRGTPAYMAPERFFGAPATVASDLYELGVVLYAMLVGRLPWTEESGPVGRLLPTHPDEAGARLPPALSTVLLRALSTRPEARPASAEAFAEEVRRALAAPRDSALQRVTAKVDAMAPTEKLDAITPVVRRASGARVRLGMGVLAALVLLGAGVLAFARPTDAVRPALPEMTLQAVQLPPVETALPAQAAEPVPAAMATPISSVARPAPVAVPAAPAPRRPRAAGSVAAPEADDPYQYRR